MSRTQHVGAEERGQALVIAQSLMMLSDLRVPIISVVTGEGGSGGALALAVSDRLIMFSNTVFSVASAEACTSILCKNGEKDIDEMAAGMKLTAQDLQDLKITDEIIEEPIGGIHLDFTASAEKLGESNVQVQKIMNYLRTYPRVITTCITLKREDVKILNSNGSLVIGHFC